MQDELNRLHATLLNRNWILFWGLYREMVTLTPDIRGFPLLLDCRSGSLERCPPRKKSRVELLKAKVEPLLT